MIPPEPVVSSSPATPACQCGHEQSHHRGPSGHCNVGLYSCTCRTFSPAPSPATPAGDGCYICQPDNPQAAEEGCDDCDRASDAYHAALNAPSPASPAETREGWDYDPETDRLVFKALREHRGAGDFREQGVCQCGWRRHEGWPSHDEHRARVVAQVLAASPAVSLPGEQPGGDECLRACDNWRSPEPFHLCAREQGHPGPHTCQPGSDCQDCRHRGRCDETSRCRLRAAASLPGEAEKQVAAVRIALELESWVIERGAHDRGVQLACARIRAALDDPQSFLDPRPMQAAPSLPGEQPVEDWLLGESPDPRLPGEQPGGEERAALVHAANVMAKLEHYGPGIVGHLLDTDDNEGEYLRAALADLGIEASWSAPALPGERADEEETDV